MNGIEKITGRIEADAREQASAITADAEAKCAEIRAGLRCCACRAFAASATA